MEGIRPPGVDPPDDLTNRTIGRFEVRELLGTGGTGRVYRALDRTLLRPVALKHLVGGFADDCEQRDRLLREARGAAALRHPAIVAVHDVFEEAGRVFLVEDFVEGTPLRDLLGSPYPLDKFAVFAEDCAGALAAAGDKGIVHCDLKPENIIITADGRPHICDFGLAHHCAAPPRPDDVTVTMETIEDGSDLTESAPPARAGDAAAVNDPSRRAGPAASCGHAIEGTPGYLAPERIRGAPPDARTDLFALGVIFYEMLAGGHPFRRDTRRETIAAILGETPPLPSAHNPALPPEADRLVMRLLDKNPATRCASPQELLEILQDFTGRLSATGPAGRPARRRLVLALWGASAGIVAALAFWAIREFVPRQLGGADGVVSYLVVEPFRSLSPTPGDTVLALGLAEAIQSRLAGVPGIQVVSAAADPGTPLLLEGTVQRSDNRLRITCRVTERKQGTIVGGAVAEGSAGELFALQDKMITAVAKMLSRRLRLPEESRPTADVTAYGFYLQGRGYLQRPGETEDHLLAVELFQRALAADPGFALAEAGLAQAYWKLYLDNKDPSWAAKAEETARRALELAPRTAEAHVALGTIQAGRGDPSLAAEEFRRALRIDPRNGEAFVGLANSQRAQGDLTAAEGTFREAIAARPGDWSPYSQLGAFYREYGRLDEALQCLTHVVELTPDNARGYVNIGAVFQEMGRDSEAIGSYERSLRIKPGYRAYANLATLYRSQGRLAEAARTYEQALAVDDHDYRVWGSLGGTYRLISERGGAADSAYRQAIRLAEGQLAVNSRDPLLLAMLAQFYGDLGERVSAREMARRALENGGGRPDVLVLVSGAYEVLEDRAAALKIVRKAVALGCDREMWTRDPAMADLVSRPEFLEIVGAAESPEAGGER